MAGVRFQSRSGRWWSEYNVRAQAHVERVSPLITTSPFLIAQDLLGLRGFGVQNLRGGFNFQRERGRVAITRTGRAALGCSPSLNDLPGIAA